MPSKPREEETKEIQKVGPPTKVGSKKEVVNENLHSDLVAIEESRTMPLYLIAFQWMSFKCSNSTPLKSLHRSGS